MTRIVSFIVASVFLLPFIGRSQTIGTWDRIQLRSTFPLWDVTFVDTLRGYIVGDFGVILRTTDGGFTWTQQLSPDQFALRNVHFFDDSTGLAAGFRGNIIRSTDGGDSWKTVPIDLDINFPGMTVHGSTVWLCGEEGIVLKSTDRGKSWKTIKVDSELFLGSISFADERHGWMASLQRKLWRSTDGGQRWEEQALDTFLPVSYVKAVSPTECWLAGYNGLILHTTDAGRTWSRYTSYQTDYFSMNFDSTGTGWAVGRRGAIVRGREYNRNWKLHDIPDSKNIHRITFLSNGAAFAVGEDGAVFRLHSLAAGELPELPIESEQRDVEEQ
jgi:photosystem II stability/assembly factor-like uncharacterized protein